MNQENTIQQLQTSKTVLGHYCHDLVGLLTVYKDLPTAEERLQMRPRLRETKRIIDRERRRYLHLLDQVGAMVAGRD